MDISSKTWRRGTPPRRVLAVRLQAMGDLVVTLPYLQHLKRVLPPSSELDLLTREEVDDIPRNVHLFDRVYSLGGGRSFEKQLLHACRLLPRLLFQRYDVVIDLQNNLVSRVVRRALRPEAWSAFDRFSPIAAGERTRRTIEAIGLGECFADSRFRLKNGRDGFDLLKAHGWDGVSRLVVLNPAGAFVTRNWPIERYADFAGRWLQWFPDTQFLTVGVNTIGEKAAYLKRELGNTFIDLVGRTTPAQAFAVMQHVYFVLSEDSGLMHMAWVSGIRTLAMFGNTRSDWAAPLGTHTMALHSCGLCANCTLERCTYGDTRCLTRYTPEFVFEKALTLVK